MRTRTRATVATGALMLAGMAAMGPSDLRAQESDSMAWLALSGCWVEAGAPADGPMICVVPENGGATMLTVSRTGVTERQQLDATGADRVVDAGGCAGVEAAEASRNGARLFTRSRLSCDGGTERSTRGLIAMVSPEEWIRVRALTVGKGSASWVTRYRAAPPSRVAEAGLTELTEATSRRGMAIEMARMAASAAPTVDEIIEAHSRTDAEAVRAWIAEQGQAIDLDADALIRMADANVEPSVIDVAVAVSYPERFIVARQSDRRLASGTQRGEWDRYGYRSRRCDLSPYSYDPFFFGHQRYGSRYDCGYSPYRTRGYHGYYGYNTPTVVVVQPVGEARPSGKAVKGRGYTRSGPAATSGGVRATRPNSARRGQGYSGGTAATGSSKASTSTGSAKSKGKAKPKGGGGG